MTQTEIDARKELAAGAGRHATDQQKRLGAQT